VGEDITILCVSSTRILKILMEKVFANLKERRGLCFRGIEKSSMFL
jgi:hypothetical protein